MNESDKDIFQRYTETAKHESYIHWETNWTACYAIHEKASSSWTEMVVQYLSNFVGHDIWSRSQDSALEKWHQRSLELAGIMCVMSCQKNIHGKYAKGRRSTKRAGLHSLFSHLLSLFYPYMQDGNSLVKYMPTCVFSAFVVFAKLLSVVGSVGILTTFVFSSWSWLRPTYCWPLGGTMAPEGRELIVRPGSVRWQSQIWPTA